MDKPSASPIAVKGEQAEQEPEEQLQNGQAQSRSLMDRMKGRSKPNEESKEKTAVVPFFQLFKYSEGFEIYYLLLGAIGGMVHGVTMPMFVIVFGAIIDSFGQLAQDAETDPNAQIELVSEIGNQAKWFLILGTIAFFASIIQVRFALVFAHRVSNRLRRLYFTSLMSQDMTWYDNVETGELTTRISSDINLIEAGIGDKVVSAIQFLTTFVVGIIIAFVYSWKLTLVVLSSSPFLVIGGALFAKVAASGASATQSAYASAGAIATEVLSLIRTVTAFSGQETEAKRYEEKLQSAYVASVRNSLYRGMAVGFTYFVIFATFSIAFIYGGLLVRQKEIDGGDVVVTFFGVFVATMSLGQATPAFNAFSVARGAAPKVYEVIQRTSEIDPLNDTDGIKPASFNGEIRFDNIKFNYPTRQIDEEADARPFVLDDFNLDVRAGTSHALVGPSGCGKSTTVRLIERFYDVEGGKVLFDGIDSREYNVEWLRSQIGYVGQMPTLFMLSIHDNIALGGSDVEKVTKEEVVEAAKMANAHDFIMKLPQQYDTMLGERGALLSGGQKQRICIARALVRNPKILLLDESTSALDAQSERHVQDALEKASEGRTTITIAHRLSTVKNAHTISLIDGGRVKEQGTHEELMRLGGAYKTLVENQTIAALKTEEEAEGAGQGAGSTSLTKGHDSLTRGRSTSRSKGKSLDIDGEAIEEEEEDAKATDKGIVLRTLKFNLKELPFIIIGMLGAAAAGSAFPLMAIAFADVLGDIFLPDNEAAVRRAAIYFVLIGVGSFIGNTLQYSMLGVSGGRLTRKLRALTFRALLKQEIGFFDQKKNAVGQLTTRLATEASLAQGLTGDTLGSATFVFSALMTGILVAYLSCWEVAAVITLVVPLMALSESIQVKMLAGFDADSGSKFAAAGAVASEAIDNLDTVSSLGIQSYFINRYEEELKIPLENGRRKALISGVTFGVSEFLLQALWAIAFWVGSVFVRNGRCEFINLMKGISGLLFAGSSLGQTSQFMPDFPKSQVAATQIFRLLDRIPDMVLSGTKTKPHDEVTGEIEANGLHFEYPTRQNVPVLRSLSLKAKSGQTVALVGASGCGKSTIIALLQRFYDARAGGVLVDGTDTREYELPNLRSHLGLVSQEPDLFNRTVRENIEYGLLGSGDGNPAVITESMVEEAAKEANCHDFIMNLPEKYETVVGPRGDRLSGGQRQRVAIARTLIRRPKILLLDEATSALDSVSEQIVQRALNEASADRTTIAIAHRLSTVKDADVIYVIDGGKVIERGRHESLMAKNGAYATLVKNQTDQVE